MKQTAIVTGASSGIGLAICKMLCNKDIKVIAIARDFNKKEVFEHENLEKIECDLQETQKLCDILSRLQKENEINILINNAGVGYYGLHEEQNYKKIQEMVRVNLEAPMIITYKLLRTLKKNKATIINISSVTATKSNPHGCAYGATKAGLTSFSHSLFDEARKYGVKVVCIQPDMTKTNLYRNADFDVDENEGCYLEPQEVAGAVEYVLEQRSKMVVTDITLKPQYHRIRRKK